MKKSGGLYLNQMIKDNVRGNGTKQHDVFLMDSMRTQSYFCDILAKDA